MLTVAVPANATTGPISLTVAGQTAKSLTNFTFIAGPVILSVSPQYLVSISSAITVPNFQVTGVDLTGSTFTFAPAFIPALITVNSATINGAGTSAVLNLIIAPGTLGSFTLVAASSGSAPSPVPRAANTLQIITPDADADGDGLTNAVEIAIGTNPLNSDTSGDGLPDGWQVFYSLNPLDPTVAGKDFDNSGLTVLQDFQMGLSPRNPNRVPPAVSQVNPKNGATGVFVNNVVVVRFNEPLLTGASFSAAQNAITAALGANSSVSVSSQQIAAQMLQAYMNRTCCGNSVIAGTVTLAGPVGAVAGIVTPSVDGLFATFAPSQPLESNTNYTFQVNGVRDAAGNLMTTPFVSLFKTGSSLDQAALQIVQTNQVNGASNVPTNVNVAVTFSGAIDPSTVGLASFFIADTTTGLPISGLIKMDPIYTIATFVPTAPLTIGHSFSVTLITAIKDQTGNSLLGNASFGFTTGRVSQQADSVTFSLLNGATPPPPPVPMEADSLTFSLLNGGPAPPPPGPGEADSLTFSLLNGETPPGATVYEADSLTFSLHNLAPKSSSTSRASRLDGTSNGRWGLLLNTSRRRHPNRGLQPRCRQQRRLLARAPSPMPCQPTAEQALLLRADQNLNETLTPTSRRDNLSLRIHILEHEMSIKSNSKSVAGIRRMSLLSLIVLFGLALAASAQTFSSGSNGSDGAFEPTGPAGTVINFVPANFAGNQHSLNIFNFTTITIPAGITARISSKNVPGPIFWLASGGVDIEGTIDLSGQAGVPASPNLDGRRRAVEAGAEGYDGGVGGETDGSSTPNEPVALPGDGSDGGAAGSLANCNLPQPAWRHVFRQQLSCPSGWRFRRGRRALRRHSWISAVWSERRGWWRSVADC